MSGFGRKTESARWRLQAKGPTDDGFITVELWTAKVGRGGLCTRGATCPSGGLAVVNQPFAEEKCMYRYVYVFTLLESIYLTETKLLVHM